MFRGYVESSLSLCLQLLLSTPSTHVDVLYAIAKLVLFRNRVPLIYYKLFLDICSDHCCGTGIADDHRQNRAHTNVVSHCMFNALRAL